jgi:glycosyltransferase involved in cell wall biosynthesis
MKIAMFTAEFPPYPGGIATYCYELAAAASRLGHDITVFTFGRDPEPRQEFEVISIRPYFFETQKFPLASLQMLYHASRRKFDLIFAADMKDMIAASFLPLRIEKRAAVHGTDVGSRVLTGYLSAFKPYARYDKIIANSEFTRKHLLKHHKYIGSDRILVAPLGVDAYWFAQPPASDVQALNKRFGHLGDRITLISVGRIEPRKGQRQAIAAIQTLPEQLRSRITYLIVGRAVEDSYTKLLSREIGSADCDVRLVGDIPRGELRALYASANILMHTAAADPIRVEGFGLVVLEAAASGLPTLATRVDALPEVVIDKVSGTLAEDGDIVDIGNKIVQMVNLGDEEREALQGRCKKFALSYTWDRCAEIALG